MNNETVTVQLSNEDAKMFVEFQKRYAFMQLLDSIGAFDLRSGSLTIHFDAYGQIASLQKSEHYKL
jgi:hypothetical protein